MTVTLEMESYLECSGVQTLTVAAFQQEKCQQEKEDEPDKLLSVAAVEVTIKLVDMIKHLMDRIDKLEGVARVTGVTPTKHLQKRKDTSGTQRKGDAGCVVDWDILLSNAVKTNPRPREKVRMMVDACQALRNDR